MARALVKALVVVKWHDISQSQGGRHELFSAIRPEVLLRTPRSGTGVFQ